MLRKSFSPNKIQPSKEKALCSLLAAFDGDWNVWSSNKPHCKTRRTKANAIRIPEGKQKEPGALRTLSSCYTSRGLSSILSGILTLFSGFWDVFNSLFHVSYPNSGSVTLMDKWRPGCGYDQRPSMTFSVLRWVLPLDSITHMESSLVTPFVTYLIGQVLSHLQSSPVTTDTE